VLEQLRAVTRGRFEIETELGEGGMAAVYLAYEPALDRKVAIKVMSPAVLMQHGMVSRFKQEAVTIAALKHSNIITVHAVEHHDQLHFFVLDYIEGGSLESVIKRCGPLPIPIVGAWLAQVAGALEYAHRRGVVHRDIKPANILLDIEGNAIVTDFGIAKVTEKRGLTATGSTIGTPTYMSPEQCLGLPVTGVSDQYSLGIVVYEMLAGAPPFSGATFAVMQAHTEAAPTPIADIRPDCPPELARAIDCMLEKEPARRWQSLAEVIAAYGGATPGLHDPVRDQMAAMARGEQAVGDLAALTTPARPATPATPATPIPTGAPPSAGIRRRVLQRPAGVLGLAVVGVAAAVGVVLLTQSRAPETRPDGGTVASVEIASVSGPLTVGDTVRLSAILRDSMGGALANEPIVWTSSRETVAAIVDGLLTARGVGDATITASGGGLTETVTIVVTALRDSIGQDTGPGVLASVRVTPRTLSLAPGESRLLAAAALDASGRAIRGRRASWSVRDATVASVSGTGQVTALAVGATEIFAAIDGTRGVARVTVTVRAETVASVSVTPTSLELESGQSAQLTALVQGTRGTRITDRAVEWRSTDPAVASVSAAGLVTAAGQGTAGISAEVDARAGQATVTVRARAPVIDEAEAARQIRRWIETFVTELDAAVRRNDLAAVQRAYQVQMPSDDVTEWRQRLALDARWKASLARTYPPSMVGNNWVSDFEVDIEVEASGQTRRTVQRFFVVFEPQAGGLRIVNLDMRLSVES
jgi:serine/threonine-protein kinase